MNIFRIRYLRILLIGVFAWLPAAGLLAQADSATILADRSRELIGADSLDQAYRLLASAVQSYPENYDFLELYARVSGWTGNFDEGFATVEKLDSLYPETKETRKLEIDLDYWNNDYSALLASTGAYLDDYAADPDILYKNAFALYKTGDEKNSIRILKELEKDPVTGRQAGRLLDDLGSKAAGNEVFVQYMHAVFSEDITPWRSLRAGYAHKANKLTLVAALSAGEMYDRNFGQAELEFYPKISGKFRAHLFASHTVQPVTLKDLAGARIYYLLTDGLEIGAGGRYMTYRDNEICAVEGRIDKYFGNNLLSATPGVYFSSGGKYNFSGSVQYRRYFNKEEWIGITGIYGYYPYDRTQSDFSSQVNARGFYGEYLGRIFRQQYIRLQAGYQLEETASEYSRSHYTFGIGYRTLF